MPFHSDQRLDSDHREDRRKRTSSESEVVFAPMQSDRSKLLVGNWRPAAGFDAPRHRLPQACRSARLRGFLSGAVGIITTRP